MNSDLKKMLRLLYLVIILIVVCTFAFDFFPKLREANQLSRKIKMARLAVKTLSEAEIEKQKRNLADELERLTVGLGYIQKAVTEIKGKIGTEKNIALVTLEIEDIATRTKVDVGLIRPLTNEQKGSYEIQLIDIGFHGTYDQLTQFLDQVEESSIFMAVQDLSITKNAIIAPKLDIHLTFYVLFKAKQAKG